MNLLYIGPVFKPSGYGVAATTNVAALHKKLGDKVSILPTDKAVQATGHFRHLGSLLRVPKETPDTVIVHAVPTVLPLLAQTLPPGPRKIAYTTWEVEGFPRELREAIFTAYDLVLTPSEFSAREIAPAKYISQAWWSRTRVVPHAFDPEQWQPHTGKASGGATVRAFRFISTLTWNERKNPLGLIKAYFHAFTAKDDVELVIITPSFNSEAVDRLRALHPNPPALRFLGHDKRLSDEQYRKALGSSDVYVSLHRGEGWGLGAFEATILGLPVITTEWSAPTEFLPESTGWVGCSLSPVVYPLEIGPPRRMGKQVVRAVIRNSHEGARGDQWWAEPNLTSAASHMRSWYEHYPEQALWDSKPYTLDAVGERFMEVLE